MPGELCQFIRKLSYSNGELHVVMGYYDELELTVFSDGSVRIDQCGMLMLDELIKAVECIKKIHKELVKKNHS